jgi:hypothetical protein
MERTTSPRQGREGGAFEVFEDIFLHDEGKF